jgi:hypothetical protein
MEATLIQLSSPEKSGKERKFATVKNIVMVFWKTY